MTADHSPKQHTPNRTIDPKTGFIESSGYLSAFDAERKQAFVEALATNGLSLRATLKSLGISHTAYYDHIKRDPAFKEAVERAKGIIADELQGISLQNARNPKSVIERIFQLKWLFPERYDTQKSSGPTQVVVNIDENVLAEARARQKVIDAEIVEDQAGESAKKDGAEMITPSDQGVSDQTGSESSTTPT